jgi:RimJ/RimL family protein N-acetyltransferase
LRGAWGERDFAPLADFYANDPGANFVGGPLDADSTWRALAARIGHWHLRGFGLFAIEQKATGAWCGWCGLWQPHGWPEIELGYALVESARGRGYAIEACTCARDHAFGTMKLATLVSYILPDNIASQRVATRLGAMRDGKVVIRETTVDVWRYPHPGAAS